MADVKLPPEMEKIADKIFSMAFREKDNAVYELLYRAFSSAAYHNAPFEADPWKYDVSLTNDEKKIIYAFFARISDHFR